MLFRPIFFALSLALSVCAEPIRKTTSLVLLAKRRAVEAPTRVQNIPAIRQRQFRPQAVKAKRGDAVCQPLPSGLCSGANCEYCSTQSGCVNTMTNANNCGACGFQCAAQQNCSGGTCLCPNNQPIGTTDETNGNQSNCGFCTNDCQGNPCYKGLCAYTNNNCEASYPFISSVNTGNGQYCACSDSPTGGVDASGNTITFCENGCSTAFGYCL